MAQQDDNIKKLYDELQSTYDLGSEDDFRNYLNNAEHRKALYNELKNDYDIQDEKAFDDYLGYGNKGKAQGTTKVGSAAQQVVNEYDQSVRDNANNNNQSAPEDLSAATAGAKIGGNISLTPARPNNQQTAQPAVDNTSKSVMDANGKHVEQAKATGPKTQFVPADPNYVQATPTTESLKKYPWMQPDQVYLWNKTTKEPVVSYFDENGQAVTDEDLQIKKAKSEITGQEDTEYMHPEAAALQLPNGNTRGVRLKKGALTQMADEIMRKEYGDNYLNTQFGRDGNVYTGAERRDLGAQQLYDELNSDVRKARISFAVADDKGRSEILSRIKAKWGKVADENSLVNAVNDENAAKEDIDIVAQQNINDLNAEIQNISRQMDQRGAEIDNASSPFVDQTFNARDVDAKYRLLQSKLNYAQNALKSWQNVKNSGSLDALAGFKDAVMDISAWDFGFSDLKNAVSLLTAKGKDKQELVNLYGRSAEAAKFEDKYNPDSYRYGKIAGASIPFALQFVGTGGGFKSIGSAVSKKTTSIAEKYALEGLKKQVVKGLGVAVGDIARAYTMSGTVQGLNTISDILTRSAGELTVDKQGNYQLKSDEPLLKSIYKGVTASAIENYTEMLGERLNIGGNLMRMLPKIGLGRVSNAITKIGTQDWYKVCNNWLSRAGVNDFGGEVLEEEIGIVLNAALVGDNPLLNGNGGLLDVRTQKDILGGMLYSISAMRAGALAMYGVKKGVGSAFVKTLDMYDKMQLNQSDKGGQSIFGEGWTEIKDEIDNTPNDKVNAVIEKLAKEHPSKDEQSAIIDYAVKLLKTRGHNLGIAMASDGENDEGAQEEIKDMPDLSQPNAKYINKDDGMIHKASLYPDASDPTGTAKDVFIIKGNLVTNEDGSINKDASDKTIIYIDGNDEVHIASPDKFAAAYPPISNNEVQQANEGGENEEAQTTGSYNKGDEVNINVNGINYTAIIQGKDGFENYNVYYEDEDGMMHPAKFTADQLNEMNGKSTVSNGQQATSEQPAGVQQQVEQPVAEQTAQQEQEAQQAQEEQKPAIPTDEKGNMLYHQVPVETTINDLYDGKLDDNEIRDFVDANINEADKQLEKINKKAPKIGTNKAEYLKKKQEWQKQVEDATRIRDYWNSVKNYIAQQTHTTPEEVKAAQDELSGEAARREYQDMGGSVQQDAVSVASDFIRGAKITPESFKAETGYGTDEQRKFVGMIAKAENGGKTIDRLAEELVSYDNAEMNGVLFGGDTSSAKDAILSALQGAGTRGELKQTNEAEEQAYIDARNAARDAQYMEQYGMTYEEYLAYEEQIMPTIWREYNNYDETAFNNMYAEEIEQLIKSRENDTTGEEQADDRGNQVLSEQQVTEQRGSEGGTEPGTEVQAGVQSNNENEAAPEEASGERIPNIERGRQGYTGYIARRQQNNLETSEEINVPLSQNEQDEYGNPMVLAENGSTVFGTIESESGLTEAPIKLSLGENKVGTDGKNHGYGLLHIEAGHGEQIRNAGYQSVEQFVENVAQNYTDIKEGALIGKKQTYLLEVSDEHNNTLFIQLSNDGTYWNVNSAGIFKKKYSRRKPLIYTVPAVGKSTVTDTSEVNSGQSMGATAPAGNSSESKDSDKSAVAQTIDEKIAKAEEETDVNPTEGQKEAGNYKKGHVRIDGYDITIEQPKGSVRRGTDADGKQWEQTMNNTYGYIRGTEGVDGDHIDIFLSDNPTEGNVYVVDQVNPDGSFDEHKVMYGFQSADDARAAYLSNYKEGWKGLGTITEVSKDEFKKWVNSSHRKTKPFSEYKSVNAIGAQNEERVDNTDITPGDLLRAYESGDTKAIEAAESRMRTFIESSDDMKAVAATYFRSKDNSRKYKKDVSSGTYRTQSFIAEACKNALLKAGIPKEAFMGERKRTDFARNTSDARVLDVMSADPSFDVLLAVLNNPNTSNSTLQLIADHTQYSYLADDARRILAERDGGVRQMLGETGEKSLSAEETAIRDAVIDRLRKSGFDVITDTEEGQRVLDEANGRGVRVRMQAMLDGLTKAANTIHSWIKGNKRDRVFTIELPESTQRKIKEVMGRDFDSHNITANGIAHALKNHGIKGNKLNKNSIPLREEDAELIPYIMTAPDYVKKASTDISGRESLRFYKELSNGYVVVVEKEYKNSPNDMETITMWAETSSEATNARHKAVPDTHVPNAILSTDAAKIRKDAETAIENDEKIREHRVYHGSAAGFDNNYKAASEALNDIGFTGISYPAEYRSGGREDGARNYVIFNEEDLKITDHVRFFRTPNGETYGFTVGGRIYVDPRVATADTPIHEYAHLWASALRQGNPEEWRNVVGLMKGTPVWDEVRRRYPKLTADDDIADEVLATYSGRRGAERLKAETRKAVDGKGVFEAAQAVTAMERVKEALRKFWKGVADFLHIHYTSAEEVADRVMSDLLEGRTLKDSKEHDDTANFAKKHNLNEKDVEDYADYIRRGNLNGASRAFKEIRRKVLLDNQGASLGQFAKIFSPIEKELYERFGNIDELRQQYVQRTLDERNAMEAARKKAEEEAEAERRRLQEFQNMSSEQLDAEYMKAVEANDEIRMRNLVNEAARRNGYGDVGSEYQGVGAWSAPSNPGYESDEERRAAVENDAPDVNITDIANGYSQQPSDYFTNLRAYGTDTAYGRESAEAINKAIDEVRNGKDPMVKVYRAVPKSVKEGKLRNGDWVTPSRKYAEMHGDNRLEGDYRIIEQEVPASQIWWDGNDINEWGFDDGKGYAYRNTKNNRKLNDLITRDDKGNIIPLSQRFNARKADVRYRNTENQAATDNIEDVNKQFNQQLEGLTEENADKVTLSLGRPSAVLRAAGVEDKPMKLYGNKVIKKMRKHGFTLAEIKDLPRAVADPIAVFNNYQKNGNRSILTELQIGDKHILVSVTVGKTGVDADFNIVSSVFGKGSNNVVDWINKGYATFINKEKALDYLHFSERSISEASDNQELVSTANIIRNFENPNVLEENLVPTEQTNDIDTAVADTANKLNIGVRVAHSIDEVNNDSVRRAIEQGRRIQGFYDTRTGEIVVYAPNAVDAEDAVRTVLHEGVAHYGLRQLVGEENFGTFLDNIYNNVSDEIKSKIDDIARKNKLSTQVATEEYLASLAEKTNFEDLNASWWDKIKSLFLKLLHSIGLKGFTGVSLTDNELRYILWRSYENLKNPGRYRSIIDEARDMSMQNDLKVGNYSVQNSRNNVAEGSDNVLYREAKEVEEEINNDWRDEYDKKLPTLSFKLTEAAQDAMRSVKILQDIIAKETSAPISDDENVYWRENRLSSVNKYEQEYYNENYFKPIVTAIANLVKYGARYNDKGKDIINSDNDILKYLIAKHGIERNNYFREREAMNARKPYEDQIKELQKQVEKGEIKEEDANKKIAKLQEQADKAEMKKRVDVLHKDYSGLTELFQDKKDFDTLASSYVSDFEKKFDTEPLWDAINRATKGTLRKAFVDGLISRESYENTAKMYEYYIPLRGWANDVASEKYNYIGGKGHSSKILEISHGRTSLADNPISEIGRMMQDAISQGNRNRMKQAVYNLAMNHDTSLLNIKRQWYQNMGTKDDPIWERVFPDLNSDMTAEQVAEEVEDFESRMRELKKEGKATQSRKGLILRLHTTKREETQHRISVAINGKEYNIFVNGNPRAAQAINGELNDVDRYGSYISKINRFLSQVYTSVNPEFVVTNYQRDAGFAASIVASTEPWSYQKEWAKNMTKYNPITTGVYLDSLIKKAKTGNINTNNKAERYMQEFLSNGGETGFTNMLSADDYKKQIKRDIKSINSVVSLPKAARAAVAFTERANTVFEDATRYATYVTSREQGRTIDRSIRDAKEISLNFNTRGADGLPGDGFIYRFFRGLRRWMIFVNPSIQGLNKAGMAFRNHPLRSSMMIAGLPTLLGYALPAIMQAVVGGGDGDDDDKNVVESYKDLPKWVRRTNIAIPIGGNNFVTIPLSYELRVSYGLGEMIWEYGEGMIDKEEVAVETLSQLSDLLPVSFSNGTVAQSISPSIARPLIDIIQNRNFYGKKIYNDSQFIEGYPEYMKAYAGTPKWLVKSTEVLNSVIPNLNAGVSDKYTPGAINVNPAIIDYLLSSYLGGLYNFPSKFGKTISMIWDEDMRDIQNVPILSRNWKNSQRGNPYNSGDRYKTYMKEYDLSKQRFNGYKKEAKNDVPEFLNSLKDLLNTPSGKRMLMIDAYKRGGLDKLNQRIRDIDAYDNERYEGEKDALTKKRDEVKEELINKLDSISDGTLDFVNGEWIRK